MKKTYQNFKLLSLGVALALTLALPGPTFSQETQGAAPAKKSVLIIGGGSIGICSANYLSQKGMDVTVVDKDDVAKGCSYGNAGLIVPSSGFPLAAPGLISKGVKDFFSHKKKKPFSMKMRMDRKFLSWLYQYLKSSNEKHLQKAMPLLLEMGKQSAGLHRELEDQCQLGLLNPVGRMEIFRTPEALRDGVKKSQLLQKNGIPSKVLNLAEAKAIETNIGDNLAGAVYYPQDGNIIPYNFVKGLAEILEKKGVNILPQTEVQDFIFAGGKVVGVKTSKGILRPDAIVIASGVETPLLTKKLGLSTLIESGEGYSITIEKPANGPSVPMILGEAHVAVSPMKDKLRLAGFMGLRGLNSPFDEAAVNKILDSVKDYLPFDPRQAKVLEKWKGRRPCSPDGLPIIGVHPKYSNVFVASGHGTIGMHLGPITGKLVSELVAGEATSIDIEALRCDRF